MCHMNNQNKLYFRRRDDQELFAGDFISKIIVPHPALNFPKNITITYQVYRGWLSRGLSSWSLSKVILSDSFGESFSLCNNLNLESGVPQRITLELGDCHEEELILLAEKASKEILAKLESSTVTPKSSTEIYPTFNVTGDVIELGKHIPLPRNESENMTITNTSWKPMMKLMDTNITQPAGNDSSEIVDDKFLNLGERMPKKAKNEKRSFVSLGDTSDDDLMKAVPIREDSSAIEEPESDDMITVQLFQYRLGEVFEKAEKYARFTLFPLLSEQISNIFNFDGTEKEAAESAPIVIKSMAKNLRKYSQDEEIDVRALQSIGIKINDNIKPIEKLFNNYDQQQQSSVKIEEKIKSPKENLDNIRIDLPTYRPELMKNEKVFIPIERP
jgi:hypothetical protein